MTSKEIGELRRRMRPDRTNMTSVRGCYVSASGEILSTFRESVALMSQEDKESYLSIFRRVLSGAQDKNLIDLSFQTSQVADSDEHRLLMALRNSGLDDEQALETFYQTVTSALASEDHYLILLAHERYDVPFKAKDGAMLEDGSQVFTYVLCAVCPVKPGKAALRYNAEEKEFHNQGGAYTVGAPELGFLFPAFDGRRTNLYNCLYYSHSLANNHPELVQALFRLEPPEPAEVQKESFGELLSQSLEDACSLPLVQKVHEQLRQNIEAHKELKSDEPLVVSRQEVSDVLSTCGVEEAKLAKFNVEFDQHFGADAALSPANLIDAKKFQLKTPDVTIQVNPERTDLVQTRVIGGVKYLLICADDGVEVNGIQVDLDE